MARRAESCTPPHNDLEYMSLTKDWRRRTKSSRTRGLDTQNGFCCECGTCGGAREACAVSRSLRPVVSESQNDRARKPCHGLDSRVICNTRRLIAPMMVLVILGEERQQSEDFFQVPASSRA
jgi:hypothetical protein